VPVISCFLLFLGQQRARPWRWAGGAAQARPKLIPSDFFHNSAVFKLCCALELGQPIVVAGSEDTRLGAMMRIGQ